MSFESVVQLLPLIGMSLLAFWKLNSVLFMLTGGASMITACYMADILNGGVTDNLSLTMSLCLVGFSIICFGFAFRMMYANKKEG